MQKLALMLLLLCCFTSCKSAKRTNNHSKNTEQLRIKDNGDFPLATAVVNHARAFNGVKYRYGGITEKGMDCSGLVYVAFKKENVMLPRISKDMAKTGDAISLKEVRKGDLLFFRTNKNKNEINHVGLVINSGLNHIEFIHSTTSKGVITSTLKEPFWNNSFIEARRIL